MVDLDSNARAVFYEALDRASPDELGAFLEEACGQDPELRRRVDDLLRAHREAGNFLGGVPSNGGTIEHSPIAERPGTVIGPYKLLQQIGEGGFGIVFLAEQERPVRRQVALKVIKPGMDTREVIARFEAERQALALMDHPNIAKVHDTGATENGRPYFVMDLVKGVPITKYCDEHHLTPRQRLELFIPVCQAVQHAHQKGIIHRDLKPSNVMVALYDGKPVPKIIDFGVAKATGPKLTDRTMFTALGAVIGTFEYMSPEQAELNQLDVDTRSDVYSLGVLLYELLTGTTPLDRQRLKKSALHEVLRLIREEEPPVPSTRINSHVDLPSVATNRGTEPARLSGLVRGELDWIVMKCLEKDRNRRYETANALLLDVERYLADEPVQACSPSAGYRFKKFVRRNKVAAAFIVLLAVGIASLAVSNVMIQSALTQKNTALAEKNAALALALTNEQRATKEARMALAVSDLLRDMLCPSYPDQVKGSQYTVRELLDDFSAGLGDQLADQPDVEATIRSEIGRSYWQLGLHDRAEPHLKRALDLHRQVFGVGDKHVANSLVDYAWNLAEQNRYAEAEACVREAVSIYQKLDSNPQGTGSLANALYVMALAQLRLGDKAGYRATCKAVVDLPVRSWNDATRSRPIWVPCLAPDALDDMSRVVKRAEEFVADRSLQRRHFGLQKLGAALYRAGNYAQAALRLKESIDAYPSVSDGGDILNYDHLFLAMTKWQLGQREEARQMLAEAESAVENELQFSSTGFARRTSLELLRAEAKALIGPKTADQAVENENASVTNPVPLNPEP
jgi:serine/threonine protein kinase